MLKNQQAIDEFKRTMEQMGFKMKTLVQAEKDFVSIRMENAIVPDGVVHPIFYKVRIYQPGNSHYVEFLSDTMDVFSYSQN